MKPLLTRRHLRSVSKKFQTHDRRLASKEDLGRLNLRHHLDKLSYLTGGEATWEFVAYRYYGGVYVGPDHSHELQLEYGKLFRENGKPWETPNDYGLRSSYWKWLVTDDFEFRVSAEIDGWIYSTKRFHSDYFRNAGIRPLAANLGAVAEIIADHIRMEYRRDSGQKS